MCLNIADQVALLHIEAPHFLQNGEHVRPFVPPRCVSNGLGRADLLMPILRSGHDIENPERACFQDRRNRLTTIEAQNPARFEIHEPIGNPQGADTDQANEGALDAGEQRKRAVLRDRRDADMRTMVGLEGSRGVE